MSLDLSHLGGWIDVPERHAMAAECPSWPATPAGLYGAITPPSSILLYLAWKHVLGNYPSYVAQAIGDCVSHGHGHGNDLLQCIEIALGEPSSYRETDTEYIYGESRKVSGNLGWFDGSYGAAAIKAMKGGMVSREMLGADGAYSGSRAKSWGRLGPPADVEAKAAAFKLGAAALVKTTDECIAALWWGYPVTVSSNQGFTTTRDSDGFCRASGRWAHCMLIAGYRIDKPGFLICQSWGPTSPSGPLALDQPSFSFWADTKTVASMLSDGDSFALGKSPEFVRRTMPSDWTEA